MPDDYALHGTNGPVTPCTEVRLESVPGESVCVCVWRGKKEEESSSTCVYAGGGC